MKTYTHKGITYTKEEYFALMFGEEFMKSTNKGAKVKYKPLTIVGTNKRG